MARKSSDETLLKAYAAYTLKQAGLKEQIPDKILVPPSPFSEEINAMLDQIDPKSGPSHAPRHK